MWPPLTIGIYGVLAYTVGQRKHNQRTHRTIGAERGAVLGLILRRGIVLMTIGITLRLAGAAGLNRYLSCMLFDSRPSIRPPAQRWGALRRRSAGGVVSAARPATQVDHVVALRCDSRAAAVSGARGSTTGHDRISPPRSALSGI